MHVELKPGTGSLVLVYSPGEDEPTSRELVIVRSADTILKEETRKAEERIAYAEKSAQELSALRDKAVAECKDLRETNAKLSATNAWIQRDIGVIQSICEWWGSK